MCIFRYIRYSFCYSSMDMNEHSTYLNKRTGKCTFIDDWYWFVILPMCTLALLGTSLNVSWQQTGKYWISHILRFFMVFHNIATLFRKYITHTFYLFLCCFTIQNLQLYLNWREVRPWCLCNPDPSPSRPGCLLESSFTNANLFQGIQKDVRKLRVMCNQFLVDMPLIHWDLVKTVKDLFWERNFNFW